MDECEEDNARGDSATDGRPGNRTRGAQSVGGGGNGAEEVSG